MNSFGDSWKNFVLETSEMIWSHKHILHFLNTTFVLPQGIRSFQKSHNRWNYMCRIISVQSLFWEKQNLKLSIGQMATAGHFFQSVDLIGFQPSSTRSDMPWIHSPHPPLLGSLSWFAPFFFFAPVIQEWKCHFRLLRMTVSAKCTESKCNDNCVK